jgi:hypothetical protein
MRLVGLVSPVEKLELEQEDFSAGTANGHSAMLNV